MPLGNRLDYNLREQRMYCTQCGKEIPEQTAACPFCHHSVEPILRATPELAKESERYHIINKIGQGGMGEVFKANDLRLNRIVALKRLKPTIQNDYLSIQRFMREAKSVARLNSPDIAQVYDMGQDKQGYYISMEFIEGETLKQRLIQNGKMDLKRALFIILDVAQALSFAHKKGIIHRDIKPSNIFITKSENIKLVDFGLVQVKELEKEEITDSAASMGTPAYMSPEQKKDAHAVDSRTDIYSLGLVFCELLVGKLPRVIQLEELPALVRSIVDKALKDNPRHRYNNMPEMIADLKQLKHTLEFTPEMIEIKTAQDKKPLVVSLIILALIIGGFFVYRFYPERLFFLRGDISTTPLKLNGIIYWPEQDKDSIAIINQRYLNVGTEVHGYKVLKITKNNAVLIRKGKIYVLPFSESKQKDKER